jgi:acetyltransferase-like isoleucine patch superfamily enzyme
MVSNLEFGQRHAAAKNGESMIARRIRVGSRSFGRYIARGIRRAPVLLVLLASAACGGSRDVDSLEFATVRQASFGILTEVHVTPGWDSATASWENEISGDGKILFGFDPGALVQTAEDGTMDVTSHTVELPGLVPETQYFFQMRSTNSGGEVVAEGDVQSFTTLAVPGPSNTPPAAVDDTASADVDAPLRIDVLANDSDPDGDALAVIAVEDGAHGQVTNAGDGTVTYVRDVGFNGTDSFSYTVGDAGGLQATARVAVTVLVEVSLPPGASVGENTTLSPTATMGRDAAIGDHGSLGAGSKLKQRAHVGDGADIGENVVIGQGAIVGDGFSAGAGANVRQGARLGNDVALGADATIGNDVVVDDDVIVGVGADVKQGSRLGRATRVGVGAVVGQAVAVGAGVLIGDHAAIKQDVSIGDGARIGANAVLRANVRIGAGATVMDGAVVPAGTIVPDFGTY